MLFNKQVSVFYWNFNLRMNILFFLFIFLLKSPIFISAQSLPSADSAVRSADYFAKMPRVSVPDLPFLFLNQGEIEAARVLSEKEDWAKKSKENYIRIAETWVFRDYDFIIKIIPAKGSLYINAFGMDLDPVHQKKLKWRGWEDPLHVIAEDGTIYPNATHKDDGSGWIVPETKRKFYFMALANGRILKQLETIELPALVNAYLLTGRETYAERALWILDAIATIYPRANEGPIDYPDLAPGKADGGRLDRPYYQAARAMMNYAFFYEMLVNSIHARKASRSNNGMTQIKNIEPKEVWGIFHQMTQIPRPSNHEEKIQEWTVNFGKSLGLETLKDEVGNVIIRKPATPGMENRKGIIFQGHLDMVPQKNSDKTHDFETDPIEAVIDGEWVIANGTTLGADNGIGVSSALAVLA